MFVKIRRLLASIIDFYIIGIAIGFPLQLIDKMFNNRILNAILGITFIVLFLYLFFRKDCLFGSESLGKKIMDLKIYQNNKVLVDKQILKDRVESTFWIFPFYPFMILHNNKSNGDIKLNTEVK